MSCYTKRLQSAPSHSLFLLLSYFNSSFRIDLNVSLTHTHLYTVGGIFSGKIPTPLPAFMAQNVCHGRHEVETGRVREREGDVNLKAETAIDAWRLRPTPFDNPHE